MRFVFVMVSFFLACFLTACSGLGTSTAPAPAPDTEDEFRKAVSVHVDAVQNRDLETLLDTITTGEDLTLIFPNGTTYSTRKEYVDFHREWFADESWTMEMVPESFLVRGDLGIALMRTTYTDEAGPRQALLSLTFTREEGQWRLVFDQNTRIVEK
ncbi:MAG: nuclear transport factor 2 family protein [Acidobacteriota bacterium]|nr:nuclear transport factor 2 family protein [Acidobacteriota bacterium]